MEQPAAGQNSPEAYQNGLERAMTLVWAEKQKHSVITPVYFALSKLWDELYREAHRSDVH